MIDTEAEQARLHRAAAGLRQRGTLASFETGTVGGTGDVGLRAAIDEHYRTRRALMRRLRDEYASVTLPDRFDVVDRCHSSPGVHLVATRAATAGPRLPDAADARQALRGCLETVLGVGPVTACRLRAGGLTSVEDLLGLAPYREGAAEVLAEWDLPDLASICARLTRRMGERGHLLSALVCAMVRLEDIAFLDLETMGLWNNVVFLAGVGQVSDGAVRVEQYLAPSHADEPAVIAAALRRLSTAKVVVTYNGRTADLPWLMSRALYYGLGPVPSLVHVDLMYGTRRRYLRDEERLPNARLPVVSDEILRLERPRSDVPGWLIPDVYANYCRAPDRREGMLVPVLEHNRADLEALVRLLEVLCEQARSRHEAPV